MNEKSFIELTIEYYNKFNDPFPTHLHGDEDELKRLIIQALESNEPLPQERLIDSQ